MSNFNEFLNYLFSMSSNDRGKGFERYCKWFLQNDSRYSMKLKTVWLWNDWPDNWGRDKGIDLIAETKQGEFWAIQAKAYDENYYIKKEDVDKFLSESSRKQIVFRLLISTTNHIGANAQEVMNAQEKLVGRCLLSDLESSILEWPLSVESLTPRIIKNKKNPWRYQEKAIKDILDGFEKSWYGQLHMACGTGKTLVALWVSERLKCHHTLVLVSSISLVSQIYKEWSENSNKNFDPVFICSDPTVSDKSGDKDQMRSNVSELGFPVTTKASDIVKYFSSNSNSKIVFSTYHSSPVIAQACKLDSLLKFDLVIADEAHRCAGAAKSDFATIVNQTAIKTTHKLFMTATPKIFSNNVKQKTKELDYEIVSMDDEDKFGPVFHKLSFSDAIKQDLLSDYQVFISVMNNRLYREYAERGRIVSVEDHEVVGPAMITDARTLAGKILVAKAIKKFNLKRVISFHNRKRAAKEFVDSFTKIYPLLSADEKPEIGFKDSIFGEIPQDKRLEIMKHFEVVLDGKSNLLSNVKCLSEGVDVPDLDGIAFIEPKGSVIDIVQAVGRVIRKPKNNNVKKIGTIIIPIFVDDVIDEEIAIATSCFQPVVKVVRALRAHDDVLAEELDNLRLEMGKGTYKKASQLSKIIFDVPVEIEKTFGESVLLKHLVEGCSSSWFYFFGLLEEFRRINPGEWPNAKEIFRGYKLGSWCHVQRQLFKNKQLEKRKKVLLESINFIWEVKKNTWFNQYAHLKNFRIRFPDRWPMDKEIFPEKNNLGTWCGAQRQFFKRKKLDKWKIKLLNDIEFPWDFIKDVWNRQFDTLKEFRSLNPNRWPTAQAEFPSGNKLGSWCVHQRVSKKNNILEDWQVKELNSINFIWNPKYDNWNQKYAYLEEFRKINPDRWPRQTEEFPPGNKIGSWCGFQRQFKKKGFLRKWQIDALNDINFPWNPWSEAGFKASNFKFTWKQQFEHLKQFRTINPAKWPTDEDELPKGNKLAKWGSKQRSAYRKQALDPWQIRKLDSLGFIWDPIENEWDRKYEVLVKFRKIHPNRWPKDKEIWPSDSDFNLGVWCGTQRSAFKRKKLSSNKKSNLDKIGFPWLVKRGPVSL